jgi:YhcH/YjgK/YiaL family protein
MIIDDRKNIGKYAGVSERMGKALKYLSETDFVSMKPGRYTVEGDDIFVLVQEYGTKPVSEGKWEAHKRYIDIQYVVSGTEKMGYAFAKDLTEDTEYDKTNDFLLYIGKGNMLVCRKGTFVIFFPDDAHMPCIRSGKTNNVKKAVIKVKV